MLLLIEVKHHGPCGGCVSRPFIRCFRIFAGWWWLKTDLNGGFLSHFWFVFSIIHHQFWSFWGTPILGNLQIDPNRLFRRVKTHEDTSSEDSWGAYGRWVVETVLICESGFWKSFFWIPKLLSAEHLFIAKQYQAVTCYCALASYISYIYIYMQAFVCCIMLYTTSESFCNYPQVYIYIHNYIHYITLHIIDIERYKDIFYPFQDANPNDAPGMLWGHNYAMEPFSTIGAERVGPPDGKVHRKSRWVRSFLRYVLDCQCWVIRPRGWYHRKNR